MVIRPNVPTIEYELYRHSLPPIWECGFFKTRFIYNEFNFIIYAREYKGEDPVGMMYVEIDKYSKGISKGTIYLQIVNDDNIKIDWKVVSNGKVIINPCGISLHLATSWFKTLINAIYIIMYEQKTRGVVYSTAESHKSTSTNTSANEKPNHIIKLNDDRKQYISSDENHSKRNMVCECWSVRGHYRHYKSGKVVFVESFNKGKKRNTTEPIPKTYK